MKEHNSVSVLHRLISGAPALALIVGLLAAMSVMVAEVVPAQDAASYNQGQAAAGRSLYNGYCKSCHGAAGKGDGMLAKSLSREPADLTALTAKFDGKFPTETLAKIIDGREDVPGHATSPDMPNWGDAFSKASDDADVDMDGSLVCSDCDDGNADVQATPSEALTLRFSLSPEELQWDPPLALGGAFVNYDTVRSLDAADFVAGAICVESDDGTDNRASDPDIPGLGVVFHYLVRAENACGVGSAGENSSGLERAAKLCP